MSVAPDDRRYTDLHVWVKFADRGARVGISDFAQRALGELVFVQLPEIGRTCVAGASLGELESLKSTSDFYAPISGTVVDTNALLGERPELVNSDPYGDGWLVEIEPDGAATAPLLSASEYRSMTSDDE